MDRETFLRSMPPAYASVFDAEAVEQHAAIVSRRGTAPVHLELWRALPELAIVCVVAKDAPGLLSQVASVLAGQSLTIEAAQIYTRQSEGGYNEAVDFFWVRPLGGGALGVGAIAAISKALSARFVGG